MGTAEVLASQEIMPDRRVTNQEQLLFGAQGVDGRVPRGFWDPCRPTVGMQRKSQWDEGTEGLGWLNPVSSLQSTNDSVLAVGFSPRDSSCIVTSGKSHVHFWNWSGAAGVPGNGTLTRKQGVFGVRCGWVQGGGEGRWRWK